MIPILITKRHVTRFYFSIVFAFIFFNTIGIVILWMFIDLYKKNALELEAYLLLVICIFPIYLAFYSVIQYYKNAPIISINNENICFGREKFKISEIKEISLTGKFPFKYIIEFPMEGTLIIFNNNQRKFIYDDMYSNTWKLKTLLEKLIIDKKRRFAENENEHVNNNTLRLESPIRFKGNQFTSFYGIILWGFIFFIILINFKLIITNFYIAFIIISIIILWFLIFSFLMYYFEITNKYLIIKNHNFFWKQYVVNLKDIKEVIFETGYQKPYCLRVITNNYQNKLFPASSLRKNAWLDLKKKLEQQGIVVRNECVY